jgi:hypothetical protein
MEFKALSAAKKSANAKQPETKQKLVEGAQNILKHIPGEASGFYLIAVDSLQNPGITSLWVIFILALILLIAVRWAADASKWVMGTTIAAFFLWMFVIDNGVFHVLFPTLLPDPWGLILAGFYSTLVTVLASTGKIK